MQTQPRPDGNNKNNKNECSLLADWLLYGPRLHDKSATVLACCWDSHLVSTPTVPLASRECMYTHSSLSPPEGGCASCCHSAIQEQTFCTGRQELFINSAFQNKWGVLTRCAHLNNCSTCAAAASLTVQLCADLNDS